MKIGARYAELLTSRLSRWDEKTRLSVRITESFMMMSQGSSWRIALPARLSYSVIVSIASRRLKNRPHCRLRVRLSPAGEKERGGWHLHRRARAVLLPGEKVRMRVFQQSARRNYRKKFPISNRSLADFTELVRKGLLSR